MVDRPLDDKKGPQTSPAKKPYSAPTLLEWGTMRDITLNHGPSGASDGA